MTVSIPRANLLSAKVVEAPRYAYRETECCCTISLIVSWILYALPACGGFLSAELSGKLDALLRRLKRFGYIRDNLRFQELLDTTDEDLFNNMCRSQHCLHHLLPPLRSDNSSRERGHSFSLPDYNTNTHKKSFMITCATLFYILMSESLSVLYIFMCVCHLY